MRPEAWAAHSPPAVAADWAIPAVPLRFGLGRSVMGVGSAHRIGPSGPRRASRVRVLPSGPSGAVGPALDGCRACGFGVGRARRGRRRRGRLRPRRAPPGSRSPRPASSARRRLALRRGVGGEEVPVVVEVGDRARVPWDAAEPPRLGGRRPAAGRRFDVLGPEPADLAEGNWTSRAFGVVDRESPAVEVGTQGPTSQTIICHWIWHWYWAGSLQVCQSGLELGDAERGRSRAAHGARQRCNGVQPGDAPPGAGTGAGRSRCGPGTTGPIIASHRARTPGRRVAVEVDLAAGLFRPG